jgi:hypothetical protein
MRFLPILALGVFAFVTDCAPRWVLLTENPTTKYYLDTGSTVRSSEVDWTVRERFLDKNSDRWTLEVEVQYNCRERTFMTRQLWVFVEQRPVRTPEVIGGNTPVTVTPGSGEEVRLEAICAIVEGRGGDTPVSLPLASASTHYSRKSQ